MIIRRYLANQLLTSAFAVTALLTFILMSSRIIKYFSMVAEGRLDVELLSAVLLYRLPGFLELLLPLGLFIAVLLVFGRLYIDNEMAVLAASGVSRWQLLGHALPSVLFVTLITGLLSFYITPHGNKASDDLFAQQAARNTFDLIRAGQFQKVDDNMLYAESLSADKKQLLNVLVYTEKARAEGQRQRAIVQAATAQRYRDPQTGIAYIELRNGNRYEVEAGKKAYNRLHFDRYLLRLQTPEAENSQPSNIASTTTTDLLAHKANDRTALAEWLWRISLTLLAPIGVLLALPLAKVNPRQGRFFKLLPAMLLYISFVVLVAAARNALEKGKTGISAVWFVHVGYLVLGLFLLGWDDLKLRYQTYRRRQELTP